MSEKARENKWKDETEREKLTNKHDKEKLKEENGTTERDRKRETGNRKTKLRV